MRLFLCLLVLLFTGCAAGTSGQECLIVDIRDVTCVDFNATRLVPGVQLEQLSKEEVVATNPEQFGDLCAEKCCQNARCNVAEVSFDPTEDTCQLIRCWPLDKCVWKQKTDTLSVLLAKYDTTTAAMVTSTAQAPSTQGSFTTQAPLVATNNQASDVNSSNAAGTTQAPGNAGNVTPAQSNGISPAAQQNVPQQMTTQAPYAPPTTQSPQPPPYNPATEPNDIFQNNTPQAANQFTTTIQPAVQSTSTLQPQQQWYQTTPNNPEQNSSVQQQPQPNDTVQQPQPNNTVQQQPQPNNTVQQQPQFNNTVQQQSQPNNTAKQNVPEKQFSNPQPTTVTPPMPNSSTNATMQSAPATSNPTNSTIPNANNTATSKTETASNGTSPLNETGSLNDTLPQTNATAAPAMVFGDGQKLSSYSLAAIFGTSITVSLLVVFIVSHRFYESWKRRHYKQINA